MPVLPGAVAVASMECAGRSCGSGLPALITAFFESGASGDHLEDHGGMHASHSHHLGSFLHDRSSEGSFVEDRPWGNDLAAFLDTPHRAGALRRGITAFGHDSSSSEPASAVSRSQSTSFLSGGMNLQQLQDRQTQLRVAFTIHGTTVATSMGAFSRLVYKIAKKKLAEEEEAEAQEPENISSDESSLENGDLFKKSPQAQQGTTRLPSSGRVVQICKKHEPDARTAETVF
eukprot:TRINITY_DN103035_c0_g1_i1.p1 TRINITY_DN103035_c0_g1~~TRINITY_DN103035_c0_g1_i1.p1  ORF type:complete len:247 (-),score=40.39 TRINITY_DN103035_c0_g1_i1:67-759(-)